MYDVKVAFVGDKPSRLNIHPDIPFVGARCFGRLLQYIRETMPDYYIVLNSTDADMFKACALVADGFQFIALGNKASKRLTETGIEHFKLPHPSGRNRKINDGTKIQQDLEKAFWYLREAYGTKRTK